MLIHHQCMTLHIVLAYLTKSFAFCIYIFVYFILFLSCILTYSIFAMVLKYNDVVFPTVIGGLQYIQKCYNVKRNVYTTWIWTCWLSCT